MTELRWVMEGVHRIDQSLHRLNSSISKVSPLSLMTREKILLYKVKHARWKSSSYILSLPVSDTKTSLGSCCLLPFVLSVMFAVETHTVVVSNAPAHSGSGCFCTSSLLLIAAIFYSAHSPNVFCCTSPICQLYRCYHSNQLLLSFDSNVFAEVIMMNNKITICSLNGWCSFIRIAPSLIIFLLLSLRKFSWSKT